MVAGPSKVPRCPQCGAAGKAARRYSLKSLNDPGTPIPGVWQCRKNSSHRWQEVRRVETLTRGHIHALRDGVARVQGETRGTITSWRSAVLAQLDVAEEALAAAERLLLAAEQEGV